MAAALAIAAFGGCSKREPDATRPAVASALQSSRRAAPAAPPSAAKPGAGRELHGGLWWYADTLDAALDAAEREGKLVFVDLWADWCHTCLSMREFVLTKEHLAGVEDRLVFLAIDTEKRANEPLLRRLPIGAWPTFYVVDPELEIHGRWVGAASPAKLAAFVKDAFRSYDAQAGGALPPDDPLALVVVGDRLAAQARTAEAVGAYRQALDRAPPDWSRRWEALSALAAGLAKLERRDECVELGLARLGEPGEVASATDFSGRVLGCASGLPKGDPRARKLRAAAEKKLAGLCDSGSGELSPDDRGDACAVLGEVRQALGDERGVRAALEQRLSVLAAAAESLPDRVALTYDSARADALVQLGRGDEAIALLSARERALPDDYNPPHFLARSYRDLGRFQEGLAPVERALAKAEAPRRAAILGVKVDLLFGLGRDKEAKRVLAEQLGAYRALPPGQRQERREQAVARRLEGAR